MRAKIDNPLFQAFEQRAFFCLSSVPPRQHTNPNKNSCERTLDLFYIFNPQLILSGHLWPHQCYTKIYNFYFAHANVRPSIYFVNRKYPSLSAPRCMPFCAKSAFNTLYSDGDKSLNFHQAGYPPLRYK